MMFSDTDSEENKAPSWNCTPVRALDVAFGLAVQLADVLAEDFDGPLGRVVEADDGAQQHGFAGPRSAHKPDNLATKYVEIEVVVDDVVAELRAHAAQLEHDVAAVPVIDQLPAFRPWRLPALHLPVFSAFQLRASRLCVACHQTFASRKMIENIASSTMTQKIDSTTERVVSWPTLSALPWT